MKKSLYIALITCSSLLLIPTACKQSQTTNYNQSAQAAEEVSTESIQQTASAITVKVIVENYQANNIQKTNFSSGSGILIAQSRNIYTVVTNAHVISDDNGSYQIQTFDGKKHDAILKNIKSNKSGQQDLALLQFEATEKYTPASLEDNKQVTPNQLVFASGFADTSEELTFNSGKIGQVSKKPLVGGYQIGFTNSTKQGMSGGALLNGEGKVVGILGLGAAAILDNAYLYADGSRPDAQMLKRLRNNSFALPVTQIAASITSKQEPETQARTDSKIAPSKKYTGLQGKIDSIAEKISVRIDSKNNGNGSGVIVAHNGDTYYVATAGHVVENQDDYTVVAPDGQSYSVAKATIKTFEGLDLAVVQFQSQQTYSVATLAKYDINYVQLVFVSGFPGQNATTKQQPPRILNAGVVQPKNLANFIAKDSYSLTNGYGLLYTNLSFPGMSGGAVLDSQGIVVGINTGAEDEIVVGKTGDVAEISLGYSLGIPIGTLVGLANSAKINSGWLQQDGSQPSRLTKAELASVKEQLFDSQAPSTNATETDWLNYGNQLWRSSQDDKAIAAFEQAIQLNPNSYRAYYGKGLAFFNQEQYRQANDAFKQATKLAGDFYPAWLGLGRTFINLKQYSQALNAYDQAIQLSPKDFVSYTERGRVFTELKRYSEAIADYNQAIEIKPHPWAYSNRGNPYADLKDYQAAIADYNQTIKLDPNFAGAYYNRGSVYGELKDYQAAIADYNQAIKLNPNFADAYSNRGSAYADLYDYQAAIADYSQAIKLNPNSANAYSTRGSAYYSLKDYQAMIADNNQAIKLNPNFANAYSNRGLAYYSLKDYQAAIADFNQAIKLDPNFALAYYVRANAYRSSGDTSSGIADLQKASQLYQQQGNTEGYQRTQELLQQVQGAK